MVAPQAILQRLPRLLADLLPQLQEKGLLENGEEVAQLVMQHMEQYKAALQDRDGWDPAKTAAVAAAEAGEFDLEDLGAVSEFMCAFDERYEGDSPVDDPHAGLEQCPEDPPEPVRRATPKIGRNEPCPCGSGKKYKKCCGR